MPTATTTTATFKTSYPDGSSTSSGYDANGNLISSTDRAGNVTQNTYDALNRLVKTTYPDGTTTSNQYDAAGRLSKSLDANNQATQTQGTGPTATSHSTQYTWDTNGRLAKQQTASDVTLYTWDSQDRLTDIKRGSSEATAQTQSSYQYDQDGNRIKEIQKTAQGEQTIAYLIDDTFPNAQVVESKTTINNQTSTTHYLWGKQLLKQTRGGQGTYYHQDALGSIKALSDQSGSLTDQYQYDAFGNPQSHQGTSDQPYRFAGEHYDSTAQWQYHRARWYDPNVGRFTAMDSFAGLISVPASLHRYSYAANDPVDAVDPSGLAVSLSEEMIVINDVAGSTTIRLEAGRDFIVSLLRTACNAADTVIATHRHHIIPWFLRGNGGGVKDFKNQYEMLYLTQDVHNKFHELLDFILKSNGLWGKAGPSTKEYNDFITNGGDPYKILDALLEAASIFDEVCVKTGDKYEMVNKVNTLKTLINGIS